MPSTAAARAAGKLSLPRWRLDGLQRRNVQWCLHGQLSKRRLSRPRMHARVPTTHAAAAAAGSGRVPAADDPLRRAPARLAPGDYVINCQFQSKRARKQL